MRSLAFAVVSCALVLGACEGSNPVGSNAKRSAAFLASVVHAANVDVSLPSTLYADPETNTCDLPLTYEATFDLSTPAYFDAGSVEAAGTSYSLSRLTFAALMGSTIVPGLSYTGVIHDWTLNPPHSAAPYTGNVVVQIVEGSQRWFGILNYECLAAPQGGGGGGGGSLIDPP